MVFIRQGTLALSRKKNIGRFVIPGSLLASFFVIILVFSNVTLGIYGDWFWKRNAAYVIPFFEWAVAGLVVFIALGLAYLLDFKFRKSKYPALFIILILMSGMIVDFLVIRSGRVGGDENIIAIVDPYTTGYLDAAGNIKDSDLYFKDFTEKQLKVEAFKGKAKDVHHSHVHPPGNIILSRMMLQFVANSTIAESLCDFLLPGTVRRLKQLDFTLMPYTDDFYYAAAMIFLLFTFSLTMGKAALIAALFIMSKNKFRYPGMAAAFVCFAAPGPILFLGHYDSFLFMLTAFLLLALSFLFRKSSKLGGFLVGIILGIGVFFTLAYGALILLVFAVLLVSALLNKKVPYSAVFVVVGGISVIAVAALFHINIISICFKCLENNMLFHGTVKRSLGWALYNPLECLFFVGPGACLGMFAAVAGMNLKSRKNYASPENLLIVATIILFIILCVASFSRGEFGRLVQFFTPLPLFVAAWYIFKTGISRQNYKLMGLLVLFTLSQTFVIRGWLLLVITS
jgi:hypothetical protein